MSEVTAVQEQKTNAKSVQASNGLLVQRKCACGQHTVAGDECESCRKKRLNLQRWRKDKAGPTFTAEMTSFPGAAPAGLMQPRFGHDFTQVRLRISPPLVQRQGKEETGSRLVAGKGSQPLTKSGLESSTGKGNLTTSKGAPTPKPATPKPVPAELTTANTAPGETAVPGLLVADETTDLGAGQMRKGEFLAELRPAVCAAADAELATAGRDTEGCPYLDYWFDFYDQRDAGHIERALSRYAPQSRSATSARDYIPIIAERVRQGVARWVSTGELTGVPEGVPTTIPGEAPAGTGAGIGTGGGNDAIQRKVKTGATTQEDDPVAIRDQLGSGRTLDSGVRSRMESAFGTGFGHVRLHDDGNAASLSSDQNARAFTVGEHVAFGAGEYRPGTLMGDALIAHELAHVVQQNGFDVSGHSVENSQYDELENDANSSVLRVMKSLWGSTSLMLEHATNNSKPMLNSGLQLQRCNKTPEKSESTETAGGDTTATGSGTCPTAPAWDPAKHVSPDFKLDKPAPKRSNTAPSETTTDDPTFEGAAVVDCAAKVWHYQLSSVESKGKIQIVYFTKDHYPAPTPTDDAGPLTNVTKANWKGIVKDLSKNKAGIPDFWSAYRAEDLHEYYHWSTEWQGEVKKELVNAEKDIAKLTVGFDKAKTQTDAEKSLLPDAEKAFNSAMKKARKTYDALGDSPGDPPYQAQVPAIENMIKRVNDHAKKKGWK